MSSCNTCDSQTSIVETNKDSTQKTILKQNKVHQSLYIQNIAALNNTINNTNEGQKYGSYERYLLKKKGKIFTQHGKREDETPLYGNKTKSLSLTSKNNSNCDFCS